MLEQIAYMSALADHVDDSCLKDILATSTARNPDHHITGILLYINGSFLQVIEGNPNDLVQLYERINKDPRHKSLVKVLQKNIDEREFGDWSMGWAHVNASDLDKIAGKNDFFTQGHCLTELDDTLARRILEGFKEGQWRRRLE